MTGYTVHTGASKKFVNGWDRIFGDQETASESPRSSKAGSKPKTATKADKKSSGNKKKK